MIEIEVQQVTLGYGRRVVVSGLSLDIRPGQMMGLVGPNGCGKSTIIKALSRIISPGSGRILLNGRDIARIPRIELARQLGVVPQIPLLPSTFTVFEVVLMGRNPHLGLFQYEGPRDMDIAWRAMEKTSIQNLSRRRIGDLSGGEIQCVVIARVLAQETAAMLLDEPTANLDIGRQIEVLDLIKGLCRQQGLTVVIALHDLNLAAQYCDRLALLYNGRVHAEGAPGEVINADNIRQVYGAGSYVYTHPAVNLPAVLPNAGSSKYGGG